MVIESKINYTSRVVAAPSIMQGPAVWFIYRDNGQQVKVRLSPCKQYITFSSAKLTQAEAQHIKDQNRDEKYYKKTH